MVRNREDIEKRSNRFPFFDLDAVSVFPSLSSHGAPEASRTRPPRVLLQALSLPVQAEEERDGEFGIARIGDGRIAQDNVRVVATLMVVVLLMMVRLLVHVRRRLSRNSGWVGRDFGRSTKGRRRDRTLRALIIVFDPSSRVVARHYFVAREHCRDRASFVSTRAERLARGKVPRFVAAFASSDARSPVTERRVRFVRFDLFVDANGRDGRGRGFGRQDRPSEVRARTRTTGREGRRRGRLGVETIRGEFSNEVGPVRG